MTLEEEADPIKRWKEEVSQLYDFALNNREKRRAGLLAISDALATRFLNEASVDVSGFSYVLDADSLRHIHRKHGGASERSRGQVPIVKQDILNLYLVISAPDTISRSIKSHQGLVAIDLTKKVQKHTLFYTVVAQTGRKSLASMTLYKRETK